MIRKAKSEDIGTVAAQYDALLIYEETCGTHSNWRRGVYPTRATAEAAFFAGTLYVLEEEDGLRGSIILNRLQPEEYAEIPWAFAAAAEDVWVGHTLCIPPEHAGRGYGTAFLHFLTEEARRRGGRVLRFDTWMGNGPARALYKKLGFREAGSAHVRLAGIIFEEQVFFEKDLEGMK